MLHRQVTEKANKLHIAQTVQVFLVIIHNYTGLKAINHEFVTYKCLSVIL